MLHNTRFWSHIIPHAAPARRAGLLIQPDSTLIIEHPKCATMGSATVHALKQWVHAVQIKHHSTTGPAMQHHVTTTTNRDAVAHLLFHLNKPWLGEHIGLQLHIIPSPINHNHPPVISCRWPLQRINTDQPCHPRPCAPPTASRLHCAFRAPCYPPADVHVRVVVLLETGRSWGLGVAHVTAAPASWPALDACSRSTEMAISGNQ